MRLNARTILRVFFHLASVVDCARAIINLPNTSFIALDNVEWLAAGSNVVAMSWPVLQAAFQSPSRTDNASFSGRDWTKPYPGSKMDGFETHLRIANDVSIPDGPSGNNLTTVVSAITHSIPSALMDENGLPKPVDPSWYICQHYFISTRPDPTQLVDHTCGFLPTQCLTDIKNSLTASWAADPIWPCSRYAFDLIPESCDEDLGAIRQDVLGWDYTYTGDAAKATTVMVDEVSQDTWMVGTGYGQLNDMTTYSAASNRTYILATVFGYSSKVHKTMNPQIPEVQLACLRPKWTSLPSTVTGTSSSYTSSTTTTSSVGAHHP